MIRKLLVGLLFWLCLPVFAASAALPTVTIHKAALSSLAGERSVTLPNVLEPRDFAPDGGFVRYRMQVDLPQAGDQPIGVYVPKISLSGRLIVNGQEAGSCAVGRLEDLRCLHQSTLFIVPASLWQPGTNTLEFEVYATFRQMNGLSAITIGDPVTLNNQLYTPDRLLRSDLLIGLAWLSAVLGFLSLSMSLVHRRDRVYLWFGVTSIVNAFGTFNGFVVEPAVDIEIFNWFVFSIRLISVPLLYMTLLAVFHQDKRGISIASIAVIILAPLAIWLSHNNRTLVFSLYTPLMLLGPILLIAVIRWTLKAPTIQKGIYCLLLPFLYTCGGIDWWRLGGGTQFEGIYLAPYGYGVALLVIWVLRILDVSEERKLEEKLKQSEAIFKSFFNLPLVGTAITSIEKGWVDVNDQTCEILGYTREALFTKTWAELTHPDDLAADEAYFRRMLAGEIDSYSMEKRFIRPDGTVVPTILSGGRSRFPGAPEGYFFVQILDITRRKHYETELIKARNAAERAKASLELANQELKELTAIQVEQSRIQEREQLLQDMHDGFGSQLASIRILAEQGRINAEQLPKYLQEMTADLHLIVDTLSQEDITLDSALLDMRYRIQRRFSSSSPQLHWDIALAGLPAMEPRFILHILRIMQEAFNNAVRHAQPLNIWLNATYDPAHHRLLIAVRDDGQGLPETIRPGRGLSNMQQRAREMGAQIVIANQQIGMAVELSLDFDVRNNANAR